VFINSIPQVAEVIVCGMFITTTINSQLVVDQEAAGKAHLHTPLDRTRTFYRFSCPTNADKALATRRFL